MSSVPLLCVSSLICLWGDGHRSSSDGLNILFTSTLLNNNKLSSLVFVFAVDVRSCRWRCVHLHALHLRELNVNENVATLTLLSRSPLCWRWTPVDEVPGFNIRFVQTLKQYFNLLLSMDKFTVFFQYFIPKYSIPTESLSVLDLKSCQLKHYSLYST